MRRLFCLLLLAVAACGNPARAPETPPSPARAAATPGNPAPAGGAAIGSVPTTGPASSPAPGAGAGAASPAAATVPRSAVQGLRPLGPLTARSWKVWTGDPMVLRAALLEVATSDRNPLALTAAEREAVVAELIRYSVAKDKFDFRRGQLYALVPEGWPSVADMESQPDTQAPEDRLALEIRRLLPRLRAAAAGARAEAVPYDAEIVRIETRFTPSPHEDRDARWEEGTPLDRQLPVKGMGLALPGLGPRLAAADAARASAELQGMGEAVHDLAGVWDRLLRMSTSDPARTRALRQALEKRRDGPVDFPAEFKRAADWLGKQPAPRKSAKAAS